MGDELDLRVSNSERAEVIDRLREQTTIGRLTLDEFEERIGEVYAAKTRRELDHTLRELPVSVAGAAASQPAAAPPKPAPVDDEDEVRKRYRVRVRREIGSFLSSNITCTGIWVLTGAHGYYWPGWVLFGTGLGLVGTIFHGREKERTKLEMARKASHLKQRMHEVEARYRTL